MVVYTPSKIAFLKICFSKYPHNKTSSGISVFECLTGIPEEISEDSRGRLDRFDILDFGGKFE